MALIKVNWNPDRKQLYQFGVAGLLVFGALGAWVFFTHSLFRLELSAGAAEATGIVFSAVAVYCGALAITSPRALKWLYMVLTAIALPIGIVVSHVIVFVLFYLVFTPLGLFFRLIRRDPLHRKFEPSAETYWVRRKPATDVKRYLRQA